MVIVIWIFTCSSRPRHECAQLFIFMSPPAYWLMTSGQTSSVPNLPHVNQTWKLLVSVTAFICRWEYFSPSFFQEWLISIFTFSELLVLVFLKTISMKSHSYNELTLPLCFLNILKSLLSLFYWLYQSNFFYLVYWFSFLVLVKLP